MMDPSAYLVLSGVLFGIGVVGVVARKNVPYPSPGNR